MCSKKDPRRPGYLHEGSYVYWSCNHCLASCFMGISEERDEETTRADALKKAKEHAEVYGHSMDIKLVREGEEVKRGTLGYALAKEKGWIKDGKFVRDP